MNSPLPSRTVLPENTSRIFSLHSALILVYLAIGYFFYLKGYDSGVWIIAAVVVLNLELILLQHLNRSRIDRMIRSLNQRKARDLVS